MDTFYLINYDKSIQKQRLVYKRSTDLIMEYVIFAMGLFLLLAMPNFLVVTKAFHDTTYPVWPTVFCVSWDIFILLNILLLNSVVTIKEVSKSANRNIVINILPDELNLRNLNKNVTNVIRDIRIDPFFKWGRVVTFLFAEDLVYLNITTVYKTNSFSQFSSLYNYFQCKRIARRFIKLQADQSKM